MILILAPKADAPSARIAACLERTAQPVAWFDTSAFPQQSELTVRIVRGACDTSLRAGGMTVRLEDVTSIWHPAPISPRAPQVTDCDARAFAELESRRMLEDVFAFSACRWVPGPIDVIRRAQLKLGQLRVASEVGFAIPDTMATNAPDDLLSFHRHHAGNIVSKVASADAFHATLGARFARYTEHVSPDDMTDYGALQYCPVTLQEHLDKQLEIRATVVGGRVFPAAIQSQRSCHSKLDWRRYDRGRATLRPYELPPRVSNCCVEIVRRLGLSYGAIDLVLTPGGQYVFLELNPVGQYEWVEEATGLPITEAICDLLSRRSR
jgi:glutathione synthase/RimK-type ligase-like ATP-grasp enzyme